MLINEMIDAVAEEVAGLMADRLLRLTGVNRQATLLTPSIPPTHYASTDGLTGRAYPVGEVVGGSYCRSEVVELLAQTLKEYCRDRLVMFDSVPLGLAAVRESADTLLACSGGAKIQDLSCAGFYRLDAVRGCGSGQAGPGDAD